MRKMLMSSLVLLALAALTVAPGFAADVEQATPDQPTQLDLPMEEPLMTPAEAPELQEILDPSQGLLEDKIRDCSGEDHLCPDPDNCRCLAVTATQVYCDCS